MDRQYRDYSIRQIPVNRLRPDPGQARRQFDQRDIEELALSIRQVGILQPLLVRRHDGEYQIIAGERRLRAAKMAGLPELPCILSQAEGPQAALLTLIGTGLTERVHLGTWGGKTEAVAFLPISPVQGAALLLGVFCPAAAAGKPTERAASGDLAGVASDPAKTIYATSEETTLVPAGYTYVYTGKNGETYTQTAESDLLVTPRVLTAEEAEQESSRCLGCDHFGYGVFKGGRVEKW